MLHASALSISIIQIISTIFTIVGFWYFDFTLTNLIIVFIGYFLYSGIGVSLMMHRYWTHKSFEFKNNLIKCIFSLFAILAGRGSPLGWVYVHRLHHSFSDTEKDPHDPATKHWRIFFPHLIKYGEKIDKRIIKDMLYKEHLYVNKYYILFLLVWSLILFLISFELLYFFYIVPLFLTFLSLDLFVFLTHRYGYRNFNTKDNSRNNWFISLILWGEGWHNNHHNNPRNFSTKVKWWEFDLTSSIIRLIKK